MRVEAEKKREVVIRVRDLYKVYRMGWISAGENSVPLQAPRVQENPRC